MIEIIVTVILFITVRPDQISSFIIYLYICGLHQHKACVKEKLSKPYFITKLG